MIPIANIYYLLCYAWGHFRAGEQISVGSDEVADVGNLIARVVLQGTKRLCRRGLFRSYETRSEQLQRIRGRIKFSESISLLAFESGKAACEFDELSVDNLHNQILKATLRRLSRAPGVDKDVRGESSRMAHAFQGVSDIELSAECFSRVQIYSHSSVYRFLIRVCKIAYESMLPLQDGNGWVFSDFRQEEVTMAKLFEDFVYCFYLTEQSEYAVKRDILSWDAVSADDVSMHYLPEMRTDVSLRSAKNTIVIDAKYYQRTLTFFYGKESIHAENLYQMFAYLKNLEMRGGRDAKATGIILYPTINRELDLAYEMQGHTLRVCTVNLAAPKKQIHDRLLTILSAVPFAKSLAK